MLILNVSTGANFKLLDLYCGEGLAAWGYWLSGRFSEVVGVDLNPEMSTRYAFDFIQGNALTLDYNFLSQFDFVHASPPCQAYSKATPRHLRHRHMRLIAATHHMLYATGLPYCIENVEGSGRELKPNLVMDGQSVGLPIQRRRYFHVSTLAAPRRMISSRASNNVRVHGGSLNRAGLIEAMGLNIIPEKRLDCLTMHGIEQGIPPVFTRRIAEMVLPHKVMVGMSALEATHLSMTA
jgi:DNA (cytosine-5)-methyltransferase 1